MLGCGGCQGLVSGVLSGCGLEHPCVWESTVNAGSRHCAANHSSIAPRAKGMSCHNNPLARCRPPLLVGRSGLLSWVSWQPLFSLSTFAGCADGLAVGTACVGRGGSVGGSCSWAGFWDQSSAARTVSCASRACCMWVSISRRARCRLWCACLLCAGGCCWAG